MQGVGSQVFVALLIPTLTITGVIVYYWRDIREFFQNQLSSRIRIEENSEQRSRREHHVDDKLCSICLTQPKELQVSSTCGHSFCAECILSLYRRPQEQVKCPLCRKDISLLFKLFQSTDQTLALENRLKQYNKMFDDNRPLLRRLIQFPYVLKRLWRKFFSVTFLVFFLRNLQIARWLFIVIFYILLPFDLIPQNMVGIIGYIDDFMIIMFLLVFLMTIAAMQFHRHHQ